MRVAKYMYFGAFTVGGKLLTITSIIVACVMRQFSEKGTRGVVRATSGADFKVIPNSHIIFTNSGEYGVCNILITTTPFVIRMISHMSPSGIE